MKLAIYTQYAENYGAHDWDGTGECPQYWKMKGGSTFVVENLSVEQARNAIESDIPTLRGLIEYSNHGARESVVDFSILDNDVEVSEPWETVTRLAYVDGRWVATEVEENGEYGYMRREVKVKSSSWVMVQGGERTEYKCEYELVDGRVVDQDKLGEALGV
jgi:hypothetical protein